MGHCEADAHADKNYRVLFDTEGEWFCNDARNIDTGDMPDFDLLCAGFPCQSFSIAGNRGGFADARGTLFFEITRLLKDKRPEYFLLENVPGLLSHDKGQTFHTILGALSELGYCVEWKVLNSKDFGVPQARKRVYIIGYLDGRCAGKILPYPGANPATPIQVLPGRQGSRVYHPAGVSCTLTSVTGGMGGKTGLYEVDVPIKENTKMGKAGEKIVHTLPAGSSQETLHSADQSVLEKMGTRAIYTPDRAKPRQKGKGHRVKEQEEPMFTLTTVDRHGVIQHGRIRRLTPRECLRLQGYYDEQIDRMEADTSDCQLYKQAGNGVTVNVVEAIGRRLRETDVEVKKEK